MTLMDILTQFFTNATKSMHITSAGGDSPKINRVLDVDINPTDYDEIFKAEIRKIVEEVVGGGGVAAGGPKPGLTLLGDADKTKLETLMEKSLGGPAKAREAMQFLVNPSGAIKSLLTKTGGPAAIAAVISAVVLAALIKELVRKGSVYDRTFKNLVDNRTEILRVRQQQQQILVGFDEHSPLGSQLITTTVAGTTEPRDSFNTYEVINRDSAIIEDMFSIRSNDGI